ncbi:MAG TPA: hypothetical protein VMS77_02400 [Conexivisphaerales archaeon]|nr:hypothetical protein [Conexivisphaerales archaeon]
MVIACKLFRLGLPLTLDGAFQKLEGFRVEREDEETKLQLVTEVRDLRYEGGMLRGRILKDMVIRINQRDEWRPALRTMVAPFFFKEVGGNVHLLIFEKKPRANELANDFSRILFMRPAAVVEDRITPETMEKYYESSFEDARVVYFDQVDIPNITKLALYGSGLSDTNTYRDYLTHGRLWYVVVASKSKRFIIGLTRSCVVTVFTQVDPSEVVSYVFEEIAPLASESR